MKTLKTLDDIKAFPEPVIREYISNKAVSLMNEYNVESLENIGCFVVLDSSEYQKFNTSEMEFVNVVCINNNYFLHGVRILSDSYGEDIFLPVEVVKC